MGNIQLLPIFLYIDMFKENNIDMALYIGENEIEKVYLYDDDTIEIYAEENLLYPSAPPIPKYLRFIALEDGTFTFHKTGVGNDIEYSLDNGDNWTTLASDTASPTVQSGDSIMWRAELTPSSGINQTRNYCGIGYFTSSCQYNAEGNVMSLLYADNFSGQTSLTGTVYAFAFLFTESNIVNANKLKIPATTLGNRCYMSMFKGCTSLISTPQLPAMTMTEWCYRSMFEGCTSLTRTPQLPATTLGSACYYYMFKGCTSLTTVQPLSATTLVSDCYDCMFSDCTSLTIAPQLPATTLAEKCYEAMFSGCTALTVVPELPVTTLAQRCYYAMFRDCSSLATAPELPASALTNYCYAYMFSNCTSLETAPELSAETLTQGSYQYMFSGCSSLNYIKCIATDISASNCLLNWVSGVAANGTFVKAHLMTNWTTGNSGIPTGWIVEDDYHDYSLDYLTLVPLESGTFKYFKKGTGNNIEYSTDSGTTWTSLAPNTVTPTISANEKILWRGNISPGTSSSSEGTVIFSSTGQFDAEGNPLSIIYGDNFTGKTSTPQYACSSMFSGCTNLINAENISLHETSIGRAAYPNMFWGCTSLISAPILPATSLGDYCYSRMFQNCSSITAAPELPATTLRTGSYKNMFNGCSSLNYIKMLATTTSASDCLTDWVVGVAANGTFVKDANKTLPTGTNGIPSGWTVVDNI